LSLTGFRHEGTKAQRKEDVKFKTLWLLALVAFFMIKP